MSSARARRIANAQPVVVEPTEDAILVVAEFGPMAAEIRLAAPVSVDEIQTATYEARERLAHSIELAWAALELAAPKCFRADGDNCRAPIAAGGGS